MAERVRRLVPVAVELSCGVVTGSVWFYPGFWGTLEDPPEGPDVDVGGLRDERGREVTDDDLTDDDRELLIVAAEE